MDKITIPVLTEEVIIEKQLRDTGGVRATKVIHEREEIIDVPLLREDIVVERVPVNRVLEAPAQVRHEGDTMIVPVMEEILVVERRLVLKEEIHIRKRQTQVHEPQRVVLRSEEVTLERLGAQEATDRDERAMETPTVGGKGESR